MGFDEITKYVIDLGIHQPGRQGAIFFSRFNNLNSQAINVFAKKAEIVQMDNDTLIQFRKTTHDDVEGLKAKYLDVKKIVESRKAFVKAFAPWRRAKDCFTGAVLQNVR